MLGFLGAALLPVIMAASPAQAPIVRIASADIMESGPAIAGHDVVAALRQHYGLHADTTWETVTMPLRHGGRLVIAQEFWQGVPIAGARLAVRVTADERLRQVIGRALPISTPLGDATHGDGSQRLWWPTAEGLVAARWVDRPLTYVDGLPHAPREYVAVATGEVLASEPGVVEFGATVKGWVENPITTPDPIDVAIEIPGDPPLAAETEQFVVENCVWDYEESTCAGERVPLSDDQGVFPGELPPWEDSEAHQDPADVYAPLQALQGTHRFYERLVTWGWDPDVWDIIDCTWMEVPEGECRVVILTNAQSSDEDGNPIPFNGAYYQRKGKITMGQGDTADSSFDIGVLVHEWGHHVTAAHGIGDSIGVVDDGQRWINDRSSINEGGADVYADIMGPSQELFYYFRNLGGLYLGPRARDVSIPFRCPQNIAGEVHMEGRIWASAMHSIGAAIQDAGLGDEDAFPAVFLAANAAIHNLPTDQKPMFADAGAILIDEMELTLGSAAADLTRAILDERGITSCDYQIDVLEEPTVTGVGDPLDPLHARFLILPSHSAKQDPKIAERYPKAPAVQFTVTLEAPDGGLDIEFTPDRWRTQQTGEEALDQEGLVVAALVAEGPEPVWFGFEELGDATLPINGATWQYRSEPVSEGSTRYHVVIPDLEPGTPYSIALVALTGVSSNHFLIDDMVWTVLEGVPSGTSGESESDSDSDSESDSDARPSADGEGGSRPLATACNCSSRGEGRLPFVGFMLLALLRTRRRAR